MKLLKSSFLRVVSLWKLFVSQTNVLRNKIILYVVHISDNFFRSKTRKVKSKKKGGSPNFL